MSASLGIVVIPMTVEDLTGRNVISYDLNIDFDPMVVVPASPAFTQTGTLSVGMSITANDANAGHLIISGFQDAPLVGAGTLINLRFDVIGFPSQSTALAFADYTDPDQHFDLGFIFNSGNPPAVTTNGLIHLPFDPTPTSSSTDTAICHRNWARRHRLRRQL